MATSKKSTPPKKGSGKKSPGRAPKEPAKRPVGRPPANKAAKAPAKKAAGKAPAKKAAGRPPAKKGPGRPPLKKAANKAPVKKAASKSPAKKAPGKAPAKKAAKGVGKNKLGVKNSLVNNINAKKERGDSKPKSKSTISKKAYKDMEENWGKKGGKKR
jgi:DNA-binding protein HU-beta